MGTILQAYKLPYAMHCMTYHLLGIHYRIQVIMKKKRSEKCKHCAQAVVRRNQNFRPAADPLSEGAGRTKFNQLEMVTTFTYRPSLVKIDARNFELS